MQAGFARKRNLNRQIVQPVGRVGLVIQNLRGVEEREVGYPKVSKGRKQELLQAGEILEKEE